MSKFKIGDKVFLSPDSKWVDTSGYNPLNVIGVVDELETLELSRGELGIGVLWSNGIHNSYRDYDLIPAQQPDQECTYCIIEELSAQVENLEELVSDQAHQINQLTEALVNLKNEYICRYDQAQCYFRLHDLLQKHESFQESDGSLSDDLAATIEVLQDAYDRLPNRFR